MNVDMTKEKLLHDLSIISHHIKELFPNQKCGNCGRLIKEHTDKELVKCYEKEFKQIYGIDLKKVV